MTRAPQGGVIISEPQNLYVGQPPAKAGQLPEAAPGAQPGEPGTASGPATGEGASRQEERQEASGEAPAEKLGPAVPEDAKILMNTPIGEALKDCGMRLYGWADFGYTYSSTGSGLLNVEPRENRFGREFLVNQLGIVLDRPLNQKELSFGYNVTFWAGADPSLIQPLGGLDFPPDNPRFSEDFRQLYVSAHLPILTEGGLDIQAGRMGTVIGYESALAPYRPFYSNDYQWFYAQDGAFTGILTNLHVNKQLDVINGLTLGANTFFTRRSSGVCYLGQVNYWLQEEKKTLLSASVYLGNNAIFAAPGLAGIFDTTIELRIQQNWNKCLTQVIQSDDGWDEDVPGIGTGSWYSLYNIFVYHLTPKVDLTNRVEWFDDVQGTRTGIAANYSEVTLGLDYHPAKCLRIRPEIRGDFADRPAFGVNGAAEDRSQLTAAIDVLFQF